ncbi:hypothetical protein PR202_gb24292 [Eleusine coracana subsp. coracana]|uniref:Wall-associated receptor kinase galacturonan-binding domain-containing protein n=1 Tax=Eleusine coracana subsp. coracana TaxID=191504 RepID=A0AAV5FL34_ELECO|nr:hypothetical protein PR202_gb24292 [Eleusine coracana subsp. coracana]
MVAIKACELKILDVSSVSDFGSREQVQVIRDDRGEGRGRCRLLMDNKCKKLSLRMVSSQRSIAVAPDGASSRPSISLPGCPDKCGDVSIPYPFGIGVHCSAASLSSYFTLTCNDTFHPPHPIVGNNEGEVAITDISLEHGEMRVLSPINYICFSSNTTISTKLTGGYELRPTPFLPSPSRNLFIVIGCNTLGLIGGYKGAASQYVAGCYSYCEGINSTSDGAPCAGLGCCEAAIPANLTDFGVLE